MSECLLYKPIYGVVTYNDPAWNGSGVFINQLEQGGYFSVQISRAAVGIFVGLTDGAVEINALKHGFFFSHGVFCAVENGAQVSTGATFVESDTFHILRSGSTVYYLKSEEGTTYDGLPGEVVHTSVLPSFGPVSLAALFYATGDTILTASLTASLSGGASGVLELDGHAADASGYGQAAGRFRLPGSASGSTQTRAAGVFWLDGHAADASGYGQAAGTITLPGSALSGSELRVDYAAASGYFLLEGAAGGSRYIPQGGDATFTFPGMASDRWVGNASGGFDLLGVAVGQRAGLLNYFDIELALRGQPSSADGTFYLTGSAESLAGPRFFLADSEDALHTSDDSTPSCVYGINDTLQLSGTTLARLYTDVDASDTLTFADLLSYVATALVEDSLDLADLASPDLLRLAAAADLLSLSSEGLATITALAVVLDELVLRDFAKFGALASAADTVTLADQLSSALKLILEAEDTLSLLGELRSSIVLVSRDTLELSEELVPTLRTVLAASDTLVFIGEIPIGDADYQAFVMNADTTGVTTYSSFPMDDLFVHEGVPYGLTTTGLYRLEGDDDDGESINSIIATGDMDFYTSKLKNVPRAYLHLTHSGQVILKTISSIRGSRHETYYELAERTSDSEDDVGYRRVQLGRGVRGVWWRFELHAVDGATIDFEGAEVLPVVLSRRG